MSDSAALCNKIILDKSLNTDLIISLSVVVNRITPITGRRVGELAIEQQANSFHEGPVRLEVLAEVASEINDIRAHVNECEANVQEQQERRRQCLATRVTVDTEEEEEEEQSGFVGNEFILTEANVSEEQDI